MTLAERVEQVLIDKGRPCRPLEITMAIEPFITKENLDVQIGTVLARSRRFVKLKRRLYDLSYRKEVDELSEDIFNDLYLHFMGPSPRGDSKDDTVKGRIARKLEQFILSRRKDHGLRA